MRSRITVEIDYSNGNEPVIQILRRKSDDVRDGMISSFVQSLCHSSVWCRIECVGNHYPNNHFDEQAEQRWYLRPIKPESLREQAIEMAGMAKCEADVRKGDEPQQQGYLIRDNSHGFMAFLDEKKIKYEPAEHNTILFLSDASLLFNIGVLFAEYKAKHQSK